MCSMRSIDGTTPLIECDSSRMLVLSLKPRYADAILAGSKTVELRRTRPNLTIPTLALIYSTSPVMSLVGSCRVDSIETRPLRELWPLASDRAKVSRREFDQYFQGRNEGIALHLSEPRPVQTALCLPVLRTLVEDFRPPQSFAYLSAEVGQRLLMAAA